jgi:glycosyltransferase involved in cell wall biosynthesis
VSVTRPLTILQTCFSPAWGGLEMQALETVCSLRGRGHTVLLACPRGSRLAAAARATGADVLELAVSGYVHPLAVGRLTTALWAQAIDLVHCQHSRDLATVVPAVLLSGRPTPVILSKRMGSYIRKRDPLHRFTFAHVARVLAVSDVIRANVIATTPVPPARVITIHDAVDASAFAPGAVTSSLRPEFNIPEDAAVIGMVGRFSPGKGHEDLLRAARILKEQGRRFVVMVVGEASYGEEEHEGSIRGLARTLGLNDVVVFTGFRADIPSVMASFTVFAFPSHAESFGVVLIEAMAAGLPVVSTNCDGVVDIVVDGVTGLFVPPGDPGTLAAALGRLLEDPGLRSRLGRAGRQRVLSHFDRPAGIAKLEQVYADVLEDAAGGRGGQSRSHR